MKNIILSLLLIVTFSTAVKAQDFTSKIDSFTTELNQLKHNHIYLKNIYQLNKVLLELSVLDNTLKTTINTLLIYGDDNQCDSELYTVLKENYDMNVTLLESQKDYFSSIKGTIPVCILEYDFNALEIKEIDSTCSMIDQKINQVNMTLRTYSAALRAYKQLPLKLD